MTQGYVVSFNAHSKQSVLQWLVNNMVDAEWQLTPSNLAARKGDVYRWRINKKMSDKRVWFLLEEDVQLFCMAWKTWD